MNCCTRVYRYYTCTHSVTVQQEQLILVRVQLSRYRYTFLLGDTAGTRINNYLIILKIFLK